MCQRRAEHLYTFSHAAGQHTSTPAHLGASTLFMCMAVRGDLALKSPLAARAWCCANRSTASAPFKPAVGVACARAREIPPRLYPDNQGSKLHRTAS